MKSILNTLDILVGHILAATMNILMQVILLLVAIFTLAIIPLTYFEDTLGISELDAIEIGVLVTFGLVIWRFFKRGRQLSISWWQLTRRFVFVLAITFLITSLIELMIFMLELTDKGSIGVEYINRHSDLDDFLGTIIVVLAIYAGAPLPKLWRKNSAKVSEKPESETSSDDSVQPADTAKQSSAPQVCMNKDLSKDAL